MTAAEQLDLLDALHPFTTTGVVHDVMPNMALACGQTVITIPAGDGVSYGRYLVTCPACLAAVAAPPRAITERDLYAASGLIFETQHCADGDHLICTGIVDVTDGGTVGQLTPPTKHHGPCRCECHA